ncbi:MAG: hypothetical protein U5K69_28035 [Balneolaceae bacterium]|nr:hypothetical protein [Balneolaceae bacterium]
MTTFTKYLVLVLSLCAFYIAGCSGSDELEWNHQQEYSWAELSDGYFENGEIGFSQVPSSETSITFANSITEQELSDNRHYLNGSGVAAGDIDGDGFSGSLFCRIEGE